MPCVGFEPTIPASERAKRVLGLDRSATVTGDLRIKITKLMCLVKSMFTAHTFHHLPMIVHFLLIRIVGVESKLGPLGTSATEWPLVPAPGDYDDGVFGGMKIGRGNRSTPRKPAPAPFCPQQIPLHQTRGGTRAVAAGSQRLTAWAMARPWLFIDTAILLWIRKERHCNHCIRQRGIGRPKLRKGKKEVVPVLN
jgi:hypothetical protein